MSNRVSVQRASLAALNYVAHNMREVDRREVYAGRVTDPDTLTVHIISTPGIADVVWWNDFPAVAVGAQEAWPGVWNVWAFGTEHWRDVVFALNRHAIRALKPAMINAGGWRGQCYSHEDHTDAHRWLEWLGFEREGIMRQYGRDGADFYLYAWRLSNVLQQRRHQQRGGVPAKV